MGTLAFFPWRYSRAEDKVAEFGLLLFERGARPGGSNTSLQADIDLVVEPYRLAPDRPIDRCTILTHADRDLTSDLSEEDRADYFMFSELLAFSALATRDYFEDFSYCNRDQYGLIVQGFAPGSRTVATVSRRRDGSLTNIHTRGTFLVLQPFHAPSATINFDRPLLEALLSGRDATSWSRYYEAILGFNLANTDSPQMVPAAELVLVMGALQRLLECRSGEVDELDRRLHEFLTPTIQRAPGDCMIESRDPQLTGRFRRRGRVSEGWIQDLYALRGKLAHGRIDPAYPSLWNVREHLLFASYVFPLILKRVLASEGLYTFTTRDQVDIDFFEALLCERHFAPVDDEDDVPERPWRRIRSPMRMAAQAMRLEGRFRRATGEAGGSEGP